MISPGDPVTEAMKDELGPHRLKIWWRSRVIALAPKKVEEEITFRHIAGGMYEVTYSGGFTERIKGKENLPEGAKKTK